MKLPGRPPSSALEFGVLPAGMGVDRLQVCCPDKPDLEQGQPGSSLTNGSGMAKQSHHFLEAFLQGPDPLLGLSLEGGKARDRLRDPGWVGFGQRPGGEAQSSTSRLSRACARVGERAASEGTCPKISRHGGDKVDTVSAQQTRQRDCPISGPQPPCCRDGQRTLQGVGPWSLRHSGLGPACQGLEGTTGQGLSDGSPGLQTPHDPALAPHPAGREGPMFLSAQGHTGTWGGGAA